MRVKTQGFRFLPAMIIAALAVAAALGWEQARRPAAPTPVAVVALETVIDSLEEAKAVFKGLDEERVNLENQIKEKEEQWKALDAVVKAQERGTKQYFDDLLRLVNLEGEIKNQKAAANEFLSIKVGVSVAPIYQKVLASIEKVAKREGYKVVLAMEVAPEMPPLPGFDHIRNVIASRRVIYAHPENDITNLVILDLNNVFNAGGAP